MLFLKFLRVGSVLSALVARWLDDVVSLDDSGAPTYGGLGHHTPSPARPLATSERGSQPLPLSLPLWDEG